MGKILIVEDSTFQRQMLVKIIRKEGFKGDILEAGDGDDAIGILGKNYGDTQLVLVDWNLPKISGLAFIEAMAKIPSLAKIPTVMISCETTDEKIQEARNKHPGLAGYLKKPFTQEQLTEAIKRFLK